MTRHDPEKGCGILIVAVTLLLLALAGVAVYIIGAGR